jgi:hypothetical protein
VVCAQALGEIDRGTPDIEQDSAGIEQPVHGGPFWE